jgi:hypothetical protein
MNHPIYLTRVNNATRTGAELQSDNIITNHIHYPVPVQYFKYLDLGIYNTRSPIYPSFHSFTSVIAHLPNPAQCNRCSTQMWA